MSSTNQEPEAHPQPSERPLILVSNDDGIDAPGIRALASAMTHLGETHVVAPIDEQSAVGHAITVRDPVRVRSWDFQVDGGTMSAHAVTGTPADCVKLAANQLLPRAPDLVVSGINRGPNTAVNVIYSGTVSAATEGAILGHEAIAFSLCDWQSDDYAAAAAWARRIAARVLEEGLPPGILLNVNIPAGPEEELMGIEITRQARSRWEDSFIERADPYKQPYYWLSGQFVNLDEGEHTDLDAVERGFISITPLRIDLTAHDLLDDLRAWSWDPSARAADRS